VVGYRLDELIGEGGFGQVWRATRLGDERIVAIKILHPELVRSTEAMTRFDRELAAIERLHHRSVVAALDRGVLDDGRPYLVLEYIEGPSLREVIRTRGALPPVEVLALLEPLCEALGAAHAAGLVHRDVKASNVILGHDAAGPRPVLLDFGLVKLLDQEGPGLTSSRSMLGTPAAMAPEQLRGQAVGPRTDVYALGLLAFHLLTGQPAFGATPGVVQTYLQVHGPRPRPSSKADLDPAIDEPVGRALAVDPTHRFASAAEFLAALRAVIDPAPADGDGEVLAVYVEVAPASAIATVETRLRAAGLVIGLLTPDSVLAVTRELARCGPLRAALVELVGELGAQGIDLRAALGQSQASLRGAVVDGAALDVESWTTLPLGPGVTG
jgi:serine/threonine-protein kinase